MSGRNQRAQQGRGRRQAPARGRRLVEIGNIPSSMQEPRQPGPAPPRQGAQSSSRKNDSAKLQQLLQINKALAARANKQMLLQAATVPSIPRVQYSKQEMFAGALRRTGFAARGMGYYDAFTCDPNASVLSQAIGPVTTLSGSKYFNLEPRPDMKIQYHDAETLPTDDVVGDIYSHKEVETSSTLVLLNPGSSNDDIGWIIRPENDGKLFCKVLKVPQLAELAEGGQRTSPTYESALQDQNAGNSADNSATEQTMAGSHHNPTRYVENIPLRLSVRLKNVTENLAVGGTVRILRYNGGLNMTCDEAGGNDTNNLLSQARTSSTGTGPNSTPNAWKSATTYFQLVEMIRASKRTKHYGGHELKNALQVNSYPADFVRSMTFTDSLAFGAALHRPSYCTICILIDDFVASSNQLNNAYEMVVQVQRAARFAPGSLLYSKSVTLRHHPTHGSDSSAREQLQDDKDR